MVLVNFKNNRSRMLVDNHRQGNSYGYGSTTNTYCKQFDSKKSAIVNCDDNSSMIGKM